MNEDLNRPVTFEELLAAFEKDRSGNMTFEVRSSNPDEEKEFEDAIKKLAPPPTIKED